MDNTRKQYTATERLAYSFNVYRMWAAFLDTQERMAAQESELRQFVFSYDNFTSEPESLRSVPVPNTRTHAKMAKAYAQVRALVVATYNEHSATDSPVALWHHIHGALYDLRDKTLYKHAELYEVLTDTIDMAVQIWYRVAAMATVEEYEAAMASDK